jgi:hypothetical protein
MQLDKKALGLAVGLMWGAAVALATAWVMLRGGGQHLELLGKFYIGYDVSPLGIVVGLVYGFVDGFIGGWILGWLYNRLAKTG